MGWKQAVRSLAAGFLAGALLLSPAAAKELGYPIDVAGWSGGAYPYDGGSSFGYCSVAAPYNSGITLILGLERDNFFLGLTKDGWALGSDATYSVALSVDRGTARTVSATGDGELLWIDLERDVTFLRAVQRGHRLYVTAARDTFEFELKGSNAALNKLAACMVRFTGSSLIGDPSAKPADPQAASNPFGQGQPQQEAAAPPPAGTAGVFDPEEVIELLDQIDFPRPLLMPEERLPFFEAETPFMGWVSEDTNLPVFGLLLYIEHTDKPRVALQDVVSLLVGSCEYGVASALDPLIERAGVRVAGARVLCETDKKKEELDVTYLAAIARQKGVYVFAHVGDRRSQLLLKDLNEKLKDTLLGYSY